MKVLKKLSIDKIAFCISGTPANRFDCLVKKCEDEKVTASQIQEALAVFKLYEKDAPDDLEKSIQVLAKAAVQDSSVSEEEEMEEEQDEDEDKSKSALDEIEEMDPRVKNRLDAIELEKSEPEIKDDFPSISAILPQKEEPEVMIPDMKKLRKVKADLLDPGPPTKDNPIPSLSASFAAARVYADPKYFTKKANDIEKEEEVIDDDEPEIAKKKSLDNLDETTNRIEKIEDDPFPSLITPFQMGVEPRDDN